MSDSGVETVSLWINGDYAALAESTEVLTGLSLVGDKPVNAAFDGGRLTSDAGVLLNVLG